MWYLPLKATSFQSSSCILLCPLCMWVGFDARAFTGPVRVWETVVHIRYLPQLFSTLFFDTGSLTKREDHHLNSSYWFVSSRDPPCLCRYEYPELGVKARLHSTLKWGLAGQTQVTTLARQELYQLSHLPTFENMYHRRLIKVALYMTAWWRGAQSWWTCKMIKDKRVP